MKKIVFVLIFLLVCLALFSGCTDKKNNDQQDRDVNSAVEVDEKDLEDNTSEQKTALLPDTSYTLPDGITYDFKDPNNADGIVVTPKE